MRRQIINLGKLLVKELKLEPGVDTTSRWMAHYIAEQIKISKSFTGKKKKEAEQKCFTAILELWKHRSYYAAGTRPYESFEPIFETLERLNPNSTKNFFYRIPSVEQYESSKKKGLQKEVIDLLKVAENIDNVARIWLEYIFQEATLLATDKKTATLLKNTIGLSDNIETKVVLKILSDEDDSTKKDEKRKQLTERINQLKAFEKFNKSLYKIFTKRLESLTEEQD